MAKRRTFVGTLVRARMWRGALGGSRLWMAIAGVQLARGVMRRIEGKQPKVLFTGQLEDGQTLVIANQGEGVSVSGRGQSPVEP